MTYKASINGGEGAAAGVGVDVERTAFGVGAGSAAVHVQEMRLDAKRGRRWMLYRILIECS